MEVEGYSYLVRQMRTDARNELELDLIRMGAEGVVVREMQTQISRAQVPDRAVRQGPRRRGDDRGHGDRAVRAMPPPPIYGIRKLDGRRPVQVPGPQLSVSLEGGEPEPAEPPAAEIDEGL